MRDFDKHALIAAARGVTGAFVSSAKCSAGRVGAALLSASGEIFTGICIDTSCSLGFCAEHAAIADMLKHRQSRIVAIVAVHTDGRILSPCGRCRELIRQVDAENWETRAIVTENEIVTLAALLPFEAPVGKPGEVR
jgi:cytidine deaminase